jgi:hypothetical protein
MVTPVILATWEAEDQEDHSSRPARANSLQDLISKISRAKWTGGVAQAVQCLTYKFDLTSNLISTNTHTHKL